MIEEEKTNSYTLIKILLFLFIAFLILYISNETGYYEYQVYSKARLTKDAMKKFEADVENGLDVSINDYIEEYKDYSNVVSKTGYNISTFVEKFMNESIKKTLKVFSKLFYEQHT